MLSLRSLPTTAEEVVAQLSNLAVVLAKTVVEAEGLQVMQVPLADEALPLLSCLPPSAPSPPPAAPERLPGGSPNAPSASEPPAEGTVGGPSTSERLPEETVRGSPVPSPLRLTRALVVVRTPPCEVPEASVLVRTSTDQGDFEFIDEQEEDAEMAEFKELVSISPARLFTLSF